MKGEVAASEAVRALRAELMDELRRARAEARSRDEELLEAVDELRTMLAAGLPGKDTAAPPPAAKADGHRLEPAAYRRLRRRLRRFVARALPSGGRVAVVSRGDDDLLSLPRCSAEHFPRDAGGGYLGFYPNDGNAILAHFQWVRAEGAEYLLFPATALWWLERYPIFAHYLEERFPRVAFDEDAGAIFALRSDARGERPWPERLVETLDAWEERTGSSPSVLDWNTGLELASRLPGRTVFSPPSGGGGLPYLDATVDVVAMADATACELTEARRVARLAVARFTKARAGADEDGTSGGGPTLAVEHRAERIPAMPSASIVVPTFNGIGHLRPCLRALSETLPADFSGEVLVVDDASGPETSVALGQLERVHPWLRVLRNERNAGFIASCNRGARDATGEYLVFLNDDTVPLAGWLGALLRTFRSHEDAGAVGGRLVYPDGRLQEAGGLVFRDGSGANFGRDDYDMDAPLYRHVRRVHYCSGALLATPRRLFHELGGFDVRYRPAYYEDTDYCFAVRSAGFGVYYQPQTIVVHVEGATSGTDTARGVKRFQIRNRRIFRKKWHDELRTLEPPPDSYTPGTWHRLAFQ